MPARAGDRNPKAPGTERAVRNALEPGPIERDKSCYWVAESASREQVPDPAQVAFPLLAYGCRQTDGAGRSNPPGGHGFRKTQQARYAACVVAYAGCVEPGALSPDPDVGILRKDRIEVG